ncbi:MAG TPA: S41 family peptidase [Polyangiaceae bacterium]|nr:S41 family peptidase [Polyangiaceae bacterium]
MGRRLLRQLTLGAALAALGLSLWPHVTPQDAERDPGEARSRVAVPEARPEPEPVGEEHAAECGARPLGVPSGAPPRLECVEARAIVREVHARFAGTAAAPPARLFSDLLVGWLDPHGLWSAAPDATPARTLRRHARALLDELREDDGTPCAAAVESGAALERWVTTLARTYARASAGASTVSTRRAHQLALLPAFQDDPVTESARSLSRTLAVRVASFAKAHPELGDELERVAKNRYYPELDADGWGEAVLSAAVRAYVSALDPHGAWAPFDEEWSLYADEPGLDGGPRLWGRVTRTAVGVRVLEDPTPPLEMGDLVLAVDGMLTAGMPLEQAEQLARVEPDDGATRRALVLRAGEPRPRELVVDLGVAEEPELLETPLESERVEYGDGSVVIVRLSHIADGMEDALAERLSEARAENTQGVLLDLRSNGGGSTRAALGIAGLFLPGARLFPLSARGRLVDVMRAAVPAPEHVWTGPVAALVDGYTASAAEMIAGALTAYGRGPVVGSRTFGKGCIQEYADDHTGRGVLRITSLLFALPDGAPVQGVGVSPTVLLPLPVPREREATVPGALSSYRGPDVRGNEQPHAPAWPAHGGTVGPCAEPLVCTALRRLGTPVAPLRAARGRRVTARTAAGSSAARP